MKGQDSHLNLSDYVSPGQISYQRPCGVSQHRRREDLSSSTLSPKDRKAQLETDEMRGKHCSRELLDHRD